jgi:hypothetical protein
MEVRTLSGPAILAEIDQAQLIKPAGRVNFNDIDPG